MTKTIKCFALIEALNLLRHTPQLIRDIAVHSMRG